MLTFREFYEICEGKKPDTPPHAVPGTVNRDSSGTLTYTLQSYDGPKGKASNKEIAKQVLNRSGGTKVKKHAKKVAKILEDIQARRQELQQRRLDQMQSQKQKVADYREAQQERIEKQREREQIKKELRKELQTEQVPTTKPTYFNQQIAKRQAIQKSVHARHVQQEIGAEARAQQAQKRAEMKAIMSR